MTDFNRIALMRKQLREIKELADGAFWQVLDLRILLSKAEVGLTAVDGRSSGALSEDENHEDYRPGDSSELDP